MRTRSSFGKNDTANVVSFVDVVIGVHAPPATGTVYAFQMPVLLDEKRIRDSSAENDAPPMDVVFRNCSIVYCLNGRLCAVARPASSGTAETMTAAMTTGPIHLIARSLSASTAVPE